jgi:hypothetical protein
MVQETWLSEIAEWAEEGHPAHRFQYADLSGTDPQVTIWIPCG